MGGVRCKRTDSEGCEGRNGRVMWCSAKCGAEAPRREEARIRGRETSLLTIYRAPQSVDAGFVEGFLVVIDDALGYYVNRIDALGIA